MARPDPLPPQEPKPGGESQAFEDYTNDDLSAVSSDEEEAVATDETGDDNRPSVEGPRGPAVLFGNLFG